MMMVELLVSTIAGAIVGGILVFVSTWLFDIIKIRPRFGVQVPAASKYHSTGRRKGEDVIAWKIQLTLLKGQFPIIHGVQLLNKQKTPCLLYSDNTTEHMPTGDTYIRSYKIRPVESKETINPAVSFRANCAMEEKPYYLKLYFNLNKRKIIKIPPIEIEKYLEDWQ
ncbi:hypothetical protein CEE36_02200 [candidate division TA06 bacterium B3_TA06]|uniref:Uncharacterized protein n=1 Tax=candidate division TA06 bacterium B3_TA06 TaxID=2012487 RepID=A0A532V9W3_UNCT6|nr:MAG: hypothetical protein CEE36_02200 [candidate division TA06 bacterium B3_TA06]